MVSVIKRGFDAQELEQDRMYLEGIGYAVLVEIDPNRVTNGLLIRDPVFRLIALVEEQGNIIRTAFEKGVDPEPCPPHLIVPDEVLNLNDGEEFFKRLWTVFSSLFKRSS
jgi:hypothetical protein